MSLLWGSDVSRWWLLRSKQMAFVQSEEDLVKPPCRHEDGVIPTKCQVLIHFTEFNCVIVLCVRALVPPQFYRCKDNVPQLLRDLSKMNLIGFILSRHTSSAMTKNTGRESVYVTWAAPGATLDCTWDFLLFHSFIYVWNSGRPSLMQDKNFSTAAQSFSN